MGLSLFCLEKKSQRLRTLRMPGALFQVSFTAARVLISDYMEILTSGSHEDHGGGSLKISHPHTSQAAVMQFVITVTPSRR